MIREGELIMLIETAITLVQGLIYKPGWTFTATDHSNRFEGTIKVRVDYPARNSNRDQAEHGYPQQINTRAEFAIMVADVESDVVLYRRIIDAILKIEEHETREFLRVPGTHWGPFHPHRIGGMKAWRDTQGQEYLPELAGDLQFGLA
ncbi:hypothetical protein ABGB09_34135 [Streptomyces sp. B8F3]|uniref:hypothetical protein n=1 Tax=Streptomyces sp. B8F3 TaxID=3153573 RepID=UPI00325CA2EA